MAKKNILLWWSTVCVMLKASPGGIQCDLFIQKNVCWLQQISAFFNILNSNYKKDAARTHKMFVVQIWSQPTVTVEPKLYFDKSKFNHPALVKLHNLYWCITQSCPPTAGFCIVSLQTVWLSYICNTWLITTPLLTDAVDKEKVQLSDSVLPLGMPCVFVT